MLSEPEWLLDDNAQVPIDVDEVIVIPVASVEMVEILKSSLATSGDKELENRILKSEHKLVELRRRDLAERDRDQPDLDTRE